MNHRPASLPVGLTPMQREAYAYIHGRVSEGISPSYDEIRRHLGQASKSGVHRVVQALEERGYIVRLPNRSRSLALTPSAPLPVPVKDAAGHEVGHAFAPQATFSSPLVGDLMLIARREDRDVAEVIVDAVRRYVEERNNGG